MYQNVLSFYGIIAAYLLGAGLVSWFFGFLWIKIVGTLSARTRGDLDNQLVLVSHRPFTFFIFFILLGMGKEMAQEAPGIQEAKLWGKVEQITYVALDVYKRQGLQNTP